ncbi:MAG TPA: ABC transporter permease subunit/CPBP intramembrane protease [Planctomycetota bacterium]|nr:ABC transporter permease subunit/CPBP intramembrane protease [Planctomycetota bacterium]
MEVLADGGAEKRGLSAASAAGVIFRKELLDIVRDRRAIAFAFLLPLALHPILFLIFSVASAPRPLPVLRVGVPDGGVLPGDTTGSAHPFFARLTSRGIRLVETQFSPGAIRRGDIEAYLAFEGEKLMLHHASTSPGSREARRWIREELKTYRHEVLERRFEERGAEVHPEAIVTLEASDVSSPEDRSGAWLGRVVPLFIVLLLLTGGSFAALDIVAGEKERGTLETLFIHPVSPRSIAWGKFLVVFAMSFLSLLFNFGGLALSLWLGLGSGLPGRGGASLEILLPPLSTLAVILLLVLPLGVLTSAVLLLISVFSRSYREAQTYLLPVTLVTLALGVLSLAPQATLSSIVVVVPMANAALGIREALLGKLDLVPLSITFLSSALYSVLALWKATELLQREDLILGLEPRPLLGDSSADARARRAVLFGLLMILLVYFAGTWLQARDLVSGLALTLWGLVLPPALLYPLVTRVPYRETLGLRAAPLRNYLLAPLLAALLIVVVNGYAEVQKTFLPMPSGLEEAFGRLLDLNLTPLGAIFLFAVSPAICEELLWRGAFQGDLERGGRPVRTALLVGLFFGLFHLNVYRLVPTAAVGAVLALVRTRSGSIFPCMGIHALYNGILLLLADSQLPGLEAVLVHPAVVVAATAMLLGCLACLRPPRAATSPYLPVG